LRLFSTIALFSLPLSALAGSISAPAVVGGVDASSTTVSPVAIHWNPGALGASTGFDFLMDTQLSVVSVQATATRNDGVDPNTGEPYRTATAEAKVPVFVLGMTYRLPESVPWVGDRLTLGLSAMDTFVGGGITPVPKWILTGTQQRPRLIRVTSAMRASIPRSSP
jgi:hypothetical protein